MIILYNADEKRMANIRKKLELAFPDEIVVTFVAVNDALSYIHSHQIDAVYSDVVNKGEILVYSVKKEQRNCYTAYISSKEDYGRNKYVHLGDTSANDYLELASSPETIGSKYRVHSNRVHC